MRRRTVIAGWGSLLAAGLGGCLEVQPLGGDGGGDGVGAGADGGFHETGTVEVLVDGTPVDLTADRFQAEYADEDVRFHFHEDDENWHMESERVTVAEAVDLLPRFGYERRDGAHVVTVDAETYDGREAGTEITFRVDGEAVDPVEYDLRDGDHLVLEVTTGG
jgi:hypothetical protein